MSTPFKTELDYTEACLIEAYEEAKRLLSAMPEPGSSGWADYVRMTYLRFKETGR